MADKKAIPKSIDGYLLEEVDGEVVLFHPMNRQLIYCNHSAALVWGLCDSVRTIEEICALLAQTYPEATEQIEQDVVEVINLFVDGGAISLE